MIQVEHKEINAPLPLLPEEIDPRKEKSLEIQTSLLPPVKQQLNDLLRAFGLGDDAPKNSGPSLDEALEIMTKFGPAQDHIESAIECNQLRTDFLHLQRNSSRVGHGESNDILDLLHNYKEYIRSGQLYPDHPSHAEDDSESRPKIKDKIIHKTAVLCRKVDAMIECSTRSDFGLLQAEWELWVGYLSELLPRLTSTIQALKKPEPEPANADQADTTDNLPRLIKLVIIKLLEQAVTIVKLGRIFWKKLLITPSGKTPITVSDNLSSEQFFEVRLGPEELAGMIQDFVQDLIKIVEQHQVNTKNAADLRGSIVAPGERLEAAMRPFPDFILPAASVVTPPSTQALLDDLFSDFIPPYNLAVHNLSDTVNSLKPLLEKSPHWNHRGRPQVTFL
ncbi:hypothetical protein PCANC_14080 [Puccinia coronata f. sp. avenae]|uniref:Uncharacterized protein n=1 Tax=Puccinia coronata f. sp. avenae TaxID=200324 RepID=A0A2N5SVW1_9BASI|nr:hypothetical protein PCANC_14080 [Puccinia coronata f. sp. avenae]